MASVAVKSVAAAATAPVSVLRKKKASEDESVTKVLNAISEGDLQRLRFLGEHLDNFSTMSDKDGMPLMHHGAVANNSDVLDLLVSLGCDVSSKDSRGGTAILEAAGAGSLEALKWFEENGIEGGMARPDARGDTTVHLACGRGHTDLLPWLLERGCSLEAKTVDFRARPLQYAICYDRRETVAWLLENGVDIRAQDNRQGWTSLHIAAANGRTELCKVLAEKDPELLVIRQKLRGTNPSSAVLPENVASRSGHLETFKALKKMREAHEAQGSTDASAVKRAQSAAAELLASIDAEARKEQERQNQKRERKKAKRKAKKAKQKLQKQQQQQASGICGGPGDEENIRRGRDNGSNGEEVEAEDETPAPAPAPALALAPVQAPPRPHPTANAHRHDDSDGGAWETADSRRKRRNSRARQVARSRAPAHGANSGVSQPGAHRKVSAARKGSVVPKDATHVSKSKGQQKGRARSSESGKVKQPSGKQQQQQQRRRRAKVPTPPKKPRQQDQKEQMQQQQPVTRVDRSTSPLRVDTRFEHPTSPRRGSRRFAGRDPKLDPRAPSWSPGKRRQWKAGSLGGRTSKEISVVATGPACAARLETRFSVDTTLEELKNIEVPELVASPEQAQSEFDRLLKRYVHMDASARRSARKRFAKRILEGMNTPNSYTLHFKKDKNMPDGSRSSPEVVKMADKEGSGEENIKSADATSEAPSEPNPVSTNASTSTADDARRSETRSASPVSPRYLSASSAGSNASGAEGDGWTVSVSRRKKRTKTPKKSRAGKRRSAGRKNSNKSHAGGAGRKRNRRSRSPQ